MKKYVKIIGIVLVIILVILIVVDCIRLSNSSKKLKPLITIMTKEYNEGSSYGTEYIGLGYSVKHYKIKNTLGYGTIVYLFYVIPLPYLEAH